MTMTRAEVTGIAIGAAAGIDLADGRAADLAACDADARGHDGQRRGLLAGRTPVFTEAILREDAMRWRTAGRRARRARERERRLARKSARAG